MFCVTIWSIYPFWASYRCWHVARAMTKLGSCRFRTVKFSKIKVIIIIFFFIDITISFFYFYICNWFVLLLNYKENKSILKLFLFIYMCFSKNLNKVKFYLFFSHLDNSLPLLRWECWATTSYYVKVKTIAGKFPFCIFFIPFIRRVFFSDLGESKLHKCLRHLKALKMH